MILAESELRTALESGIVALDPMVPSENIGPASIDLQLSDEFVVVDKEIEAREKIGATTVMDHGNYSFRGFVKSYGRREKVEPDGYFPLEPNRLVLGYTKERITFSNSVAGRVEGKSALARLGLFVHVTAPFIQPGFQNQLQLELYNVGPAEIRLRPGKEICQLIVESVVGEGTYTGQFQTQ